MRGSLAVRQPGFTLVELLVALAALALMALLSWRGLESISRTQQGLERRSDDLMALQSSLAQWGADLDSLEEQPGFRSLEWDGRSLRLLRRSSVEPQRGLVVVAWTRGLRDGQAYWLRWQSPPVLTRADLESAWQFAGLWAQSATEVSRRLEVRTVRIEDWQIFFYRENAWTNPLSSAGSSAQGAAPAGPAPATNPAEDLPQGVRLILNLSPGQGLLGSLTRDWARGVQGGGA